MSTTLECACCFEPMLEVAFLKEAVKILTSHLTNRPTKTKKT